MTDESVRDKARRLLAEVTDEGFWPEGIAPAPGLVAALLSENENLQTTCDEDLIHLRAAEARVQELEARIGELQPLADREAEMKKRKVAGYVPETPILDYDELYGETEDPAVTSRVGRHETGTDT